MMTEPDYLTSIEVMLDNLADISEYLRSLIPPDDSIDPVGIDAPKGTIRRVADNQVDAYQAAGWAIASCQHDHWTMVRQ